MHGTRSKDSISSSAQAAARALQARGWLLVVAESCTGGWLAKAMTDLAGSSAWLERALVTYSNEAKTELLGVGAELLAEHGAVSEACVRAMAEGALANSHGDVAAAVSGIAGPDGGTVAKPVGTVWFAWAAKDRPTHTQCRRFSGDREQVRYESVIEALEGIVHFVE